jgi:hypothetical protein
VRTLVIAIWMIAGTAQATPPTSPPVRPGNTETLDQFTVEGRRYLITQVGGKNIRAWTAARIFDPTWQLVKDFPDADHLIVSDDRVSRAFCLVRRAGGSELYWTGKWDTPALDGSAGLPATTQELWILQPRAGRPDTRDWFGIAVPAGIPKTWRLFQVRDKEHWTPLVPEGASPPFAGFLRIGRGEMALQGSDHRWRLYGQDDDGVWRAFSLPSAPRDLAEVGRFDGDQGIRARFPGERDPERAHFYHRGADGGWLTVEALVPGAPKPVRAVQGFGPGRALAIQRQPGGKSDNTAWGWSFFVLDNADHWTPLDKVLAGAPARIDSVRAFAKGRGLAVRALPDSRGGVNPDDWIYFWRGDDRGWRALADVLPDMPPHTWGVASFADDRGLGFQARGSEQTKGVYPWSWYLRDPVGPKWRKLSDVLPGAPAAIVSVVGDDATQGLRVSVDGDDSRSRWFVPDGGGWLDAARLLPGQPIIRVATAPSGAVRVMDEKGRFHWYGREGDGRWLPLVALEP